MGRIGRMLIGLCLAIPLILIAHPANAAGPLVIDTPPASALQATVTVPYAYTFTASGGTGPYTFSVKPGGGLLTLGLSLDPSGLLGGTPTALGTWIFTVVVTDAASLTAEQQVTMNVGVLPLTLGSTPPAQVTALVNFTHQFTATGGMPPYKFDGSNNDLPTGVIVEDSGLLVGVPHEVGTFHYTVDVEDFLHTHTAPVPFALVVVPPAIVSPAPTSPIYTGQDFGHAFATTAGTIGSRTFTVSAGTLPPGLTLGVGGVLSGKPMAPGTYGFTARATFVAGPVTITAEQVVTMVVATPAAAFTSAAPPNGIVGTAYTFNFTAGGDASITFSTLSGTLPPGLSLAANGALSGTPSTAGTYAFVVAAAGAGSGRGASDDDHHRAAPG